MGYYTERNDEIEKIRREHGEKAADWEQRRGSRAQSRALSGMATGAKIGSFLGPVGTGVGMVVGYVAGMTAEGDNPYIEK